MTDTPETGSLFWRLLIMGAALLASFFFSAIEFAVIRLDPLVLREDAERGSRAARLLLRFQQEPGRFLSCISIGNTLANLLLSSFVAVTFSEPLSRWLATLFPRVPYGTLEAGTTAFVTILLTYVVLVFGEITPKQFSLARGPAFARRMAEVIRGWSWFVAPAVALVSASSRFVLRLLGIRMEERESVDISERQILRQVEYGEEKGAIERGEKEMIENVFRLNDRTAADVMVHRKDVVALDADVTAAEIRETIREAGFSRYPVYVGSVDNVIGILHARDYLLAAAEGAGDPKVTAILRKAMFVPETVKADVLLKRLQKRKQSLAVVVDDFGGTSGIVAVEDLVEEVVGEIYDEYDTDAEVLRTVQLPDGRIRIPGEMSVDQVNEALGASFVEGEFGTIGGYVIEKLGTVPAAGARVHDDVSGVELRVEKLDGHRIDTLVATKKAPSPSSPAS